MAGVEDGAVLLGALGAAGVKKEAPLPARRTVIWCVMVLAHLAIRSSSCTRLRMKSYRDHKVTIPWNRDAPPPLAPTINESVNKLPVHRSFEMTSSPAAPAVIRWWPSCDKD